MTSSRLFATCLLVTFFVLVRSAPGEDLPREPDRPRVRVVSPASVDIPVGNSRIVAAVEGYVAGDQLDVFVDGRKLGTVMEPPWQLSWQAGDALRAHDISVALRRGGREVASARVRTLSAGFSSKVNADVVTVAPIVTDRHGRYVPGLTAKNFTVLDDGQPRTIETFDAADSPLSVVLVLDVSGSMLLKIDEARRAAHAFVDALKPQDEVGLITFSTTVVGSIDFTRDRRSVHAAIDAAQTNGETALYDVTAMALKRLRPLKRRKAVILFTDGDDNRSRLSVDQVIQMARASEVSIYSVAQGVTESDTLKVFLDRLAENTGGRSYFIGSIRRLPETFREILAELKSQYFLTYTPRAGLKPRTWHRIEVRVDRPELVVRARKEYFFQ
ncbi:MAG TPA: VWA domain-containing protein [Thermoanaerobaculia bacterium]